MTKTHQDPAEQDAPLGLSPLAGNLNLLEGDSVGYCSGGVCHIPASALPQKADTQ